MRASDLNLETMKAINLDTKALMPRSTATPFSTFLWAVVTGDLEMAEAQITDDVEWGLMPYNKVLKGKDEVIPWLKAGYSSNKEPIAISNAATEDWGIFEYWNIGTVTEELVKFGTQQEWPWPKDALSLVGRKYKVAQCFVYHINSHGKIDFMRQYLDAGSVWAQFK
jgi:hypothetical protein